jgi:hypothetical protein
LNQLQKETPLDQVEKLMEDTLEAIEYQRVFLLFNIKSYLTVIL